MNNTFESLFPGFIKACTDLHDLLVPFALGLLVLSFCFVFWRGPLNGPQLIQFLIRLFAIVLLITQTATVMNSAQEILQAFIDQNIPARPENVAQRYREKLADAQQATDREDTGFFQRILGADLFQGFVYGVLTLIAWGGLLINFFVYVVLKVALLLSWTLSPPLFALFAIDPLAGIAWRHLLRIVGILMAPISLALAATISEGILDGMVRDSFLKELGIAGSVGYGATNLLAIVVLAVWIAVSSIVGPLWMQRLVTQGAGAATALLRAGDLTVNLGLPAAVSLAAWGWSRVRHSETTPSPARTPESVPAMPPKTPPPAPTALSSDSSSPIWACVFPGLRSGATH
jgi:hypothetical protein